MSFIYFDYRPIEEEIFGPGLYAFWDFKGELFYIGKAQCIHDRLVSSIEQRKSQVARCAILPVKHFGDMDILEPLYIKKYRPRENKQFNSGMSDDFTDFLKDIDIETFIPVPLSGLGSRRADVWENMCLFLDACAVSLVVEKGLLTDDGMALVRRFIQGYTALVSEGMLGGVNTDRQEDYLKIWSECGQDYLDNKIKELGGHF